jgi:hypothetical protein
MDSSSDIHAQSESAERAGDLGRPFGGEHWSIRQPVRPPEPGVLLGGQPVIWNYINS